MNRSSKKAIAAGHICIDITPVFNDSRNFRPEELFIPGRLINVEAANIHTGGSVANTGLAMKLLGTDVRLMGKVGDDPFGRMILDALREEGADKGMIISKDASTSYSVVLALPQTDRIFLHHPGANDSFRSGDLVLEEEEDSVLFHFGYPPLMRAMYENSGEELFLLFSHVKERGMVTSLDMAAVDPSSDAGQQDWEAILRRVLPYVDFFLPSVEELCFMIDRPRYEEWLKRAAGKDVTEVLSVTEDIEPLAERLKELGASNFLIKCGAPGLYYEMGDAAVIGGLEKRLQFPMQDFIKKKGFEKSYRPERIRSATGAGDTTIAAFLSAMLNGYSLEWCMHLAAAAGAACVASYDALGGLKPLSELKKMVEGGWEKQELIRD